jgi:hypothetical protein
MNKLVHNERVKYTATFLNNCGVAFMTAGAVVPLLTESGMGVRVVAYVVAGLAGGWMFHQLANQALGELRE